MITFRAGCSLLRESYAISEFATFIQMIVLFWISFNLMRFPGVRRKVVLALLVGIVLLCGLLQVMGVTTEVRPYNQFDRIDALSEGTNTAAVHPGRLPAGRQQLIRAQPLRAIVDSSDPPPEVAWSLVVLEAWLAKEAATVWPGVSAQTDSVAAVAAGPAT